MGVTRGRRRRSGARGGPVVCCCSVRWADGGLRRQQVGDEDRPQRVIGNQVKRARRFWWRM